MEGRPRALHFLLLSILASSSVRGYCAVAPLTDCCCPTAPATPRPSAWCAAQEGCGTERGAGGIHAAGACAAEIPGPSSLSCACSWAAFTAPQAKRVGLDLEVGAGGRGQ